MCGVLGFWGEVERSRFEYARWTGWNIAARMAREFGVTITVH